MSTGQTGRRTFQVAAIGRPQGGLSVAIPFDPALAWGERDAYHVHGTVGRQPFRGALTSIDGAWSLQLGPAWCRSPGFQTGDEVEVVMGPEGPQSTTSGADVAVAFAAQPTAARFFDSLPSFYRKNFMRWIDGAKRPETRAKRIAETVDLARQGRRERAAGSDA